MLTGKDYCDYETCVALKELGYKGMSRFFYATKESPLRRYSYDQILTTRIADAVGHTLAISLYVAQKWLREEYNLHLEITYSPSCWTGKIYDLKEWDYIKGFTFFESFEETLHTLIKEAVKILKENETIHE